MSKSHQAADAMDWNEAMVLVQKMYDDGMVRDSLLIDTGCFLGLRVSDLLRLRWADLLSDEFVINEQKTGKTRTLRVSSSLMKHAKRCRKELGNPSLDSYVFVQAKGDKPISRQTVDLMMKKVKVQYKVKSAKVFSSHTLRKTFGRRIWLQECDKGRGDQALLLLCDVFGHSSIAITKRYLGIRQEEILSVYNSLE